MLLSRHATRRTIRTALIATSLVGLLLGVGVGCGSGDADGVSEASVPETGTKTSSKGESALDGTELAMGSDPEADASGDENGSATDSGASPNESTTVKAPTKTEGDELARAAMNSSQETSGRDGAGADSEATPVEGDPIEGAPIVGSAAKTNEVGADSPKKPKRSLDAALQVDPLTGQPLEGATIPFGGKNVDPEALAKGLVDADGNTVPAPFEPSDPSKFDVDDDGNTIIGFSQIANFKYVEPIAGKPETLKKDQFPASVLALDGKSVVMEGFMIPLEMDAENRVSVFFLARNTLACCQGRIPDINEVVEVSFEEPVKFSPDILLRVKGSFHVGEVFDEFGYLMSVYRMKGKVFETPWR